MFIVPQEVLAKRLSTCRACEYFNKDFGTCGTPLVGRPLTKEEIADIEKQNIVSWKRSKYKLCGCVMKAKARLTFAECPVSKWQKFVKLTKKEQKEMMEFVTTIRERGYLTRKEVEQLYGYAETVSGQKHEVKMCGSCVKDMVDKIYRTLKQEEV
jgi:hypothetical protein